MNTLPKEGALYRWGVYLNYYNTEVFPNNMTNLSWIGALWSFLCNSTGPLYACINSKIDDRYTILIAGILSSLSMMLASITHEVFYSCRLRTRINISMPDLGIVPFARGSGRPDSITYILSLYQSSLGHILKSAIYGSWDEHGRHWYWQPRVFEYCHRLLFNRRIQVVIKNHWVHSAGAVHYCRIVMCQTQKLFFHTWRFFLEYGRVSVQAVLDPAWCSFYRSFCVLCML